MKNTEWKSLTDLVLLATFLAFAAGHARASERLDELTQITALTPQQARQLVATFKGLDVPDGPTTFWAALPLSGLESLDADSATTLAGFQGSNLLLNGLQSLDADAAKGLAGFGGGLFLDGLTALDGEAAQAFAEFKTSNLSLDGLTSLEAISARALARCKANSLSLDGLTSLSADGARSLAAFKGSYLFLNGLTTLDEDTAEALASCNGGLSLGVRTLSADAAKAVAAGKGRLVLYALTTLSAETAAELAQSSKWDGVLSGITAFEDPDSVAIATALASRKGRLSLPNLAKISPKALTALIAKEDVAIPPLETLELIQEPDGSPTDDFVIPDNFLRRQKLQ